MLHRILEFILERPAIVVVVLVFVGQIVRGLLEARKARTAHESRRDEPADDQRVREVQEEIRRRIAARRGGAAAPAGGPSAPPPLQPTPAPAPARPETTQLPELGGPLGRMLGELQRRAQPLPVPAAPAPVAEDRSRLELERQQRLAEEIRLLEQARAAARRRAEEAAAAQAAQSSPSSRASARGLLGEALGDPGALRRAFVLREILDPPVALRRARS